MRKNILDNMLANTIEYGKEHLSHNIPKIMLAYMKKHTLENMLLNGQYNGLHNMHNNGKVLMPDNGLVNILVSIQKHMQLILLNNMKVHSKKYGKASTQDNMKATTKEYMLEYIQHNTRKHIQKHG